MTTSFVLAKMRVAHETPIRYFIESHCVNDWINKKISLHFSGEIFCLQCNRKISKTFQQAYCYPCFQRVLECNNCMIHPERCLVEAGKCSSTDWAHVQCHQPHIVYLANASGAKVGITRESNMPTRWIDQGAIQALPIFKTSNRYQAGLLEVALKAHVADKTNWRVMLQGAAPALDLLSLKKTICLAAKKEIDNIQKKYSDVITILENETVRTFEYPVKNFPEKITALSFDKTPDISGKLLGIKGQYLILDVGVLNIRKFGGYCICM